MCVIFEMLHVHHQKLKRSNNKQNFENKVFKVRFTLLKIKIIENFKLKTKSVKTKS